MTGVLLFCISKEAKRLTHKMLSEPNKHENGISACYFVESRKVIGRNDELRRELGESEKVTTEFIGGSVQECRDWALEAWKNHNKYVYPDLIFIADERSGKDDTLLVQYWPPENSEGLEPHAFPPFGVLPPKMNEWYEYRVQFKQSEALHVHLNIIDEQMRYPIYLGRKDELTNESGVFDVARVQRIWAGTSE